MFNLVCLNIIDSSHVVNVNGDDIPYNVDTNISPITQDLAAGSTVTAYVRYPSADFTFFGWSADGYSQLTTAEPIIGEYVLDLNGNKFNSAQVSSTTVAGAITENRIQFVMPSFSFQLIPLVAASDSVGISPETRIDMNNIEEVEFDGEVVSKLYIDGVLQWDDSLPAGQRFVDATAGITFLVGD